ncbi:MAG TPA: hypothetical protein VGA65_05310 [Hyphomicrobium sp.]
MIARWSHFTLRTVLVLALLAGAMAPITAGARSNAQGSQGFTRAEQILQWINDYRHHPEPKRLPAAVKAMREFGLLKDIEQGGIYIGFIAGVIGFNPDTAETLIADMFPMPPPDQIVVVKAIAYSGLSDWKDLMGKFVERMPARKVVIERYLYGKMKVLRELPLDEPIAVDANWGYYFATGSPEPIQRLVRALAWSQNKNDVEKLTVGSMVKWTLAQNASKDWELLGYLKTSLPHQPDKVAIPLKDVIESAETFELAHIRKDAMGAIEELKTKGSEASRNFSWWGQAGQTAFALGCVAAGAAGVVVAGIPCVVGGALSNVALKYLAPAP